MLLDSDMTGLLDIDEFVNGCMQLRGPAKSLQARGQEGGPIWSCPRFMAWAFCFNQTPGGENELWEQVPRIATEHIT